MRAVLFVLASFFLALSAQADERPRWGKVICEPVAEADAVQFANAHHFLDNWDFEHQADPPYVAPKGTIACTLPVSYTSDTDSDGHVFYTAEVSFLDQPFHHLQPCVVNYFGQSRPRRFTANGSGSGYVDLVPGSNDFDVSFQDADQAKFQDDEFMAIQIGRAPQIVWLGEVQDDHPHQPIVSRCHVEL